MKKIKYVILIAILQIICCISFATAQDNESAYNYFIKGDYSKAVEKYSEQIKINQEYAPIFYNRALAHLNLNDTKSAIEDLKKSLQLDPKNADAFYALSLAYIKLGEHQNAIDNINKALEMMPNNAQYSYAKANIYYMLEDDDNSIMAYNRTLELDPNNAMAYYGRAVAYTYKKENKKAKEDFYKFLDFKNIPQLYIEEANRMLDAIKIAEEYD